MVGADGSVHIEPFYTVMGFAPSKYGLAILGRASQKQVVNVAQRGGMCGVLIGRPSGRLVGPSDSASARRKQAQPTIARPVHGLRLSKGDYLKYAGSLPGFHLMLQPMLGFWSAGDRLAGQHGVEGGAQICAGDRNARVGPAGVHLAAIDQLLVFVEDEEVGRAGGLIGLGHCLRLVEQIRKRVAARLDLVHHLLGRVGRMRGRRRWS